MLLLFIEITKIKIFMYFDVLSKILLTDDISNKVFLNTSISINFVNSWRKLIPTRLKRVNFCLIANCYVQHV